MSSPAGRWEWLNCLPGTEPEAEITLAAGCLEPPVRQALMIECGPRVAAALAQAARELAGAADEGPGLFLIDRRAARLAELRRVLAERTPPAAPVCYHGRIGDFLRDVNAAADLILLGGCGGSVGPGGVSELVRLAAPGARLVLCGAVSGEDRELIAGTGAFEAESPAVWHANGICTGGGAVLPHGVMERLRSRLDRKYFALLHSTGGEYTPVAGETEEAREVSLERLRTGRAVRPAFLFEETLRRGSLPMARRYPRISIVTPAFNQGKSIEETILSVLRQGYPAVEHIVVDGGSTDETPRILDRYRDRLARVISEPDRGQSHAINKGMALATGDILTWLNSDDLLAPGALDAVALAFATSGADLVAGVCTLFRDGSPLEHHLTCCPEGPLPLAELLDVEGSVAEGRFFYQPEVMFTRDIWLRAGGHVREDLHYNMDQELWRRFAEQGARLRVIGRPVAWYRVHGGQKTADGGRVREELVRDRDRYLREKGLALPPAQPAREQRTRLRIVMVNDVGFRYGAGIAHEKIARALQLAGHEVHAIALVDESGGEVCEAGSLERALAMVASHRPDAIVAGNLHRTGTDPLLLNRLGAIAPTFFVLHDFWLLTGRCAYTGGCEKYLAGCDDSCPTPDEYPRLAPEKIAAAWRRKRDGLSSPDAPVLLAASSWAEDFARRALESAGARFAGVRLERIRLGLPPERFLPAGRGAARALLGLPRERFLVMAVSTGADPRKGLGVLLDAARRLSLPDLGILLAGGDGRGEPDLPDEVIPLGYIADPGRMALAFAAADLFVGPSGEETFGQVFIEAAAGGTPSIGIGGSGVGEAIAPGISGSVLEEPGASALAAAILAYYRDPGRRAEHGFWGRVQAECDWSLYSCYLSLFRAWDRLGLLDRWGLKRQIRFTTEPPPLRMTHVPSWEGLSPLTCHDLSPVENPIPELGLEAYRWAFGPSSRIEYRASRSGLHLFWARYRNPWEGQHVKVSLNGQQTCETGLPCTGYGSHENLLVDLPLRAGVNEIRLDFSEWNRRGPDPRPLAIMIERLEFLPMK